MAHSPHPSITAGEAWVKMDANDILGLLRILKDGGISCCFVGELALNYYNVPRVVHDLEMCVSEADLPHAQSIFASNLLLEPATEEEYNLYTAYKRGFPRFRYRHKPQIHVVLFSDTFFHLAPLGEVIVPLKEHQKGTEYSHQIMDLVSASSVASLPMPRLALFFEGFCRKFCDTRDDLSAIAAEQLVDGMNLNEDWCRSHISPKRHKELKFALKLVAGKISRISSFTTNTVTDFIASEKEAERIHKIPGRN